MNKVKNIKLLIASIITFCAIQTTVLANQQQKPILKPMVNIEKSNDFVKTYQQNVQNNYVTPNEQLQNNPFEQELNQFPEQQENTKIYKDSEGNPISKEQKERSSKLKKTYKGVTKDEHVMEALELLKGTVGSFSRNAILGNNLSGKPIEVNFEDLSKFGQNYATYVALGWKKKERLYIYINKRHEDAPAPALAAVLAHEALHQDNFNSLNEETYAWTMEAAVWTQLSEKNPQYNDSTHPLVVRENRLKKLFIKGNYTNKYIKKTVYSNFGYANLPSRSPGFEDDNL